MGILRKTVRDFVEPRNALCKLGRAVSVRRHWSPSMWWFFSLCLAIGVGCGFSMALLRFVFISLLIFAGVLGFGSAMSFPPLHSAILAAVFLQAGYFIAVLIRTLWGYRRGDPE
ncbi:MAG: hypothetical protein P4M15_02095 [Alphaproteobacteria bacterium]|nr:hypothetical protein [Alphaproteobacteria bacterium]